MDAIDKVVEEVHKRGFYKAFTDLVPHSLNMKNRTAVLLSQVREWCSENRCNMASAVGYLLHREFYHMDKKMAAIGWDLFTQGREVILTSAVPHLVALWLVERHNLGRGRYTYIRLLLLRYNLSNFNNIIDLG